MYGSPTAYSTASPTRAASAMRQKEQVLRARRPMTHAAGINPSRKPKVGCST